MRCKNLAIDEGKRGFSLYLMKGKDIILPPDLKKKKTQINDWAMVAQSLEDSSLLLPSPSLVRSWPPLAVVSDHDLGDRELLSLAISSSSLSHLVSLSLPSTLFLSLAPSLLFLSLKQLTAQTQTTTTTASMATCAGGGEPEDAKIVAVSPFRRETLSLEVVEARVGPRRKWCSNAGQRPPLTVVLGSMRFLSIPRS